MKRRSFVHAGLVASTGFAFGVPNAAHARDGFPAKPIRIIVPFVPGSAPDVFARVVGERMTARVKQPFVVENRPGATSIIGTEMAAHAAADGYTLLVATPSTAILAASNRKLNFNVAKDLQPISMGAYMAPILVTGEKSSITSVKSLIERAKANPGKLIFGSGGIGNSQHLAGEMLKQMAGIDMLHVPFSGTPVIIPSLNRGEVDVTFVDASALPLVRTGKIKAIAVGPSVRSQILPDVPTVAESGVPGFNYRSWLGLMVPTGARPEVISILNSAANEALRDREVQARLFTAGMEAAPSTVQDMSLFLSEETKRWAKVIDFAKIRFE
ncbi:tripartite tricarboxylate transporter substrate binding protein [Cupriavidus basilensis]